MDRTKWAIPILLTLFGVTCANAQDGRLQHVRDDVRPSAASDAKSNPPTNDADDGFGFGDSQGGSSSSHGSGGDDAVSVFTGLVVFAPFIIPIEVLHDTYDFRLAFAPYPYANNYHGYQLLPPDLATLYYDADSRVHHAPGDLEISNRAFDLSKATKVPKFT